MSSIHSPDFPALAHSDLNHLIRRIGSVGERGQRRAVARARSRGIVSLHRVPELCRSDVEVREARGFQARGVTPACLGSEAVVPGTVGASANHDLYWVDLARLDHFAAKGTGETGDTVFTTLDFDVVLLAFAHACILASPQSSGQRVSSI